MQTLPNFFRVDFSPQVSYLQGLQLGPVSEDDATSLAGILGSFDPTAGNGQWVGTGAGCYSLEGAEIIYVGENHDDLPTNPMFTNVVGISLSADDNGPRRIYLNYNVLA